MSPKGESTWKYCRDSLCRCWSLRIGANPVQSTLPWRPIFHPCVASFFLTFSFALLLALSLALPLSSLQTTFHSFCLDPSPLFSHSSLSLLFQILIPLNKSNHSEPSFYSRTNQSFKTFPSVSPASLHLAANALGVERFPVCCYHLQMQDRCFSCSTCFICGSQSPQKPAPWGRRFCRTRGTWAPSPTASWVPSTPLKGKMFLGLFPTRELFMP